MEGRIPPSLALVHEDERHEILKASAAMTPEDDQADTSDALKLIGRWHDLVGFTGVAICETDDPAAVAFLGTSTRRV